MPTTLAKSKQFGFSKREIELLDRVRTAAHMLATPGMRYADMVDRLAGMYDIDDKAARRLLYRAKQFIASGVPAVFDDLRRGYASRLEALIEDLYPHVLKDMVETTLMTSPGVVDKEGKPTVDKIKKRVKQNAVDVGVANVLLKAMREHAIVTGARPKDGPRSVSLTQNNNYPGAQETAGQSNDELVKGLFGEKARVIEDLPDAAKQREDPEPARLGNGQEGSQERNEA